jgi:predicted glycosyltransferase
MKIFYYCQHVLGIGHFFRSLEICRALADHEVVLITGGPPVDAQLPGHVRDIRLPDLQMNRDFKGLFSSRENRSLDDIKAHRRQILLELFERERPDVFLVELYPFGRKAFRFELDPVMRAFEAGKLPPCPVFCSVRDILVEKEDALKHETRAANTLNRFFQAVLVHADPKLARLDETFDQYDRIGIPVVYTGYIARKPHPEARQNLRRQLELRPDDRLVVASAGGGRVGAKLLEAVMVAFERLPGRNRSLLKVFSGPFLPAGDFERLIGLAGDRASVDRFTPDFLSHLAAADLSVSMGGYNTTMDILASESPALVWPFPQNREQRMRAERLAACGALQVLNDPDLHPDHLAAIMEHTLSITDRPGVSIDLDGAAKTAAWIENWAGNIDVLK